MKRSAFIVFVTCALAGVAVAQRLAVLQPRTDAEVPGFADALKNALANKTKLVDDGLAASAYSSVGVADSFNMSSAEARSVGAVIGCDRFLILRSAVQRRAASGGRSYFEAYAVAYLIDARTGLLIKFELTSVEDDNEAKAAVLLVAKAPELAESIAKAKFEPSKNETSFPEPPPENSPEAAGLKLPVPYKRIRPEYTTLASLYTAKATVDIELDIDPEGRIAASRIVRWAGFGLDESVDAAVRSMNWRPAMRGGKALPMRVLLRYNFRKIENDEEN